MKNQLNRTDPKTGHLSLFKKVLFSIFGFFIFWLIVFLMGEIIVRIFMPQEDAQLWPLSDKRYGYVMKRNFYQEYRFPKNQFVMVIRTNSLGLRGKEYGLPNDGVKKVFMLGDSFIFGQGLNIEDTVSNILEGLLNKNQEKYIVINAGVPGWGTLQETKYAKDNFDLFKPDVIVLTFCANDPRDDLEFQFNTSDNEKGILRFPGKIFLRRNSQLYRFITNKYLKIVHAKILKKRLGSMNTRDPSLLDLQSAEAITENEWNRTLEYIRKFSEDYFRFNPKGVLLLQATNPTNFQNREKLGSISDGKKLIFVDLNDEVKELKPEQAKLPYDNH